MGRVCHDNRVIAIRGYRLGNASAQRVARRIRTVVPAYEANRWIKTDQTGKKARMGR